MSEEQSDHTMVSARVAGEEAEPELPRGSSIDRYVVLELLGRGGMGVVYKAYDPQLDRSVALKLIRHTGKQRGKDAAESPSLLLREAKALAQLNHPHVVTVHDVGTVERGVFLAMEFVAGTTLREWRKAVQPSRQEVLDVMLAAGSGLSAAHKQGLVHRDFKPENIIVGEEGRVRVIDFGLARTGTIQASQDIVGKREVWEPEAKSDTTETGAVAAFKETLDPSGSALSCSRLTHAGTVVGTPAYMAPEQLLGGRLDGRADQFSYCAVLYELLYGQRPFSGRSVAELVDKVRAGRMQPPPAGAGVPQWLQSIVTRGLAVEHRRGARRG